MESQQDACHFVLSTFFSIHLSFLEFLKMRDELKRKLVGDTVFCYNSILQWRLQKKKKAEKIYLRPFPWNRSNPGKLIKNNSHICVFNIQSVVWECHSRIDESRIE